MRRTKVKVGDVLQIPLADNKFAFGRIYRDSAIGIYRKISDTSFTPPIGSRDFMFTVGVYQDVVESGKWPVVGKDAFEDPESEWPPPSYVKDPISGELQIYHQGAFSEATAAEVEGLDQAAVWDSHHIVSRILKELEID